jgi:hypothetical protein
LAGLTKQVADGGVMSNDSKEKFPWHYASLHSIKERVTEANPSPIRIIRWTEHEELMEAAQSRHAAEREALVKSINHAASVIIANFLDDLEVDDPRKNYTRKQWFKEYPNVFNPIKEALAILDNGRQG